MSVARDLIQSNLGYCEGRLAQVEADLSKEVNRHEKAKERCLVEMEELRATIIDYRAALLALGEDS